LAYPTTFKTLQDAVIKKLRLEDPGDRDSVKDWINQGYATIVMELGYLQTCATIPLTENEAEYTLPSTPQRIQGVIAQGTGTGGYGPPLQEISLDEMLRLRQSNTGVATITGTVEGYMMLGDKRIEFWPTPTQADTIKIYYTYMPTELINDADEPELREPYRKGIEYFALAEAADMLKDPGENNYRQVFEQWLLRARVDFNRRSGPGHFQIRTPAYQARYRDNSADVPANW
jgi:hypothetical protein